MRDNAELTKKIRQLAEDREERFRSDYSGRGMYGKTCVAIVTSDPNDVIAEAGVSGALVDQMGKQHVVYWPKLKTTPTEPPKS